MSIEFEGKKSVITPEGVFIIGTYDENGVPNAMNAAWGMQSDMGEITLIWFHFLTILITRQVITAIAT